MTIKIKRKYSANREVKKKMKDGELPFQETIYLFQKMFLFARDIGLIIIQKSRIMVSSDRKIYHLCLLV